MKTIEIRRWVVGLCLLSVFVSSHAIAESGYCQNYRETKASLEAMVADYSSVLAMFNSTKSTQAQIRNLSGGKIDVTVARESALNILIRTLSGGENKFYSSALVLPKGPRQIANEHRQALQIIANSLIDVSIYLAHSAEIESFRSPSCAALSQDIARINSSSSGAALAQQGGELKALAKQIDDNSVFINATLASQRSLGFSNLSAKGESLVSAYIALLSRVDSNPSGIKLGEIALHLYQCNSEGNRAFIQKELLKRQNELAQISSYMNNSCRN